MVSCSVVCLSCVMTPCFLLSCFEPSLYPSSLIFPLVSWKSLTNRSIQTHGLLSSNACAGLLPKQTIWLFRGASSVRASDIGRTTLHTSVRVRIRKHPLETTLWTADCWVIVTNGVSSVSLWKSSVTRQQKTIAWCLCTPPTNLVLWINQHFNLFR